MSIFEDLKNKVKEAEVFGVAIHDKDWMVVRSQSVYSLYIDKQLVAMYNVFSKRIHVQMPEELYNPSGLQRVRNRINSFISVFTSNTPCRITNNNVWYNKHILKPDILTRVQ